MKKYLSFLLIMLLLCGKVFASDIEIQPTMQSKTIAQDRIWVGTFQLVWNDFINKIIHIPVRFREGTPTIVQELNQQEFSTKDLSESCYYTFAGKVKKNTKKIIAKAIRKKFKETSDLFDKLELQPRNDMLLVYAMLKKDFEFLNEFDELEVSLFGENQISKYFGINEDSDKKLRNNIKILFYNSADDFAIVLPTKGDDEVYLYKNPSNKAFNLIYDDMNKKTLLFKGDIYFTKSDELRIPYISIDEEKSFDELKGKRIMGTNYVISQALETIKFNMDNKGVKLKSEAAMTVMTTALAPAVEPRYFYLDNTFVLFLKEKSKNTPYFAMRVNDISKFQK